MKLTIMNGCCIDNMLQHELREFYKEKRTDSVDWINLDNIKYCRGCDYCQTINPGLCAIQDGQNEVLQRYMNSDKVIIITPVIFGCCNSRVKNFIDRTEPLFLPFQVLKDGESIMKGRYEKYPELTFIAVCEDKNIDAAENFKKFIYSCNLSLVSHRVIVKIILHSVKITDIEDLMLLEE